MKKRIELILIRLAQSDLLWMIIRPFVTIGNILFIARKNYEKRNSIVISNVEQYDFLRTLQVRNGPFSGMKYPGFASFGSAFAPKLLGSYELEIQPAVEQFLKTKNYAEIIDVGCAEGYYAVGFALRSKSSRVFAYDSEESARKLCKEMAKLNGVSDRVKIGSLFTPEELAIFQFSGRGLIICDCEGFEKELFNEKNLRNISNCDLIIETHDFIDINISSYIKDLLSASHKIDSVMSIDDIQKVLSYDYRELKELNFEDRKYLLAEGRPAIMEWLICTSKTII